MDTHDLVLCESADGWSLHAPDATDEAIAAGHALPVLTGTFKITRARKEPDRLEEDNRASEMSVDPEAKAYKRDIINAAEREPEALIDGIKRLFNCHYVEVSDIGAIWIEDAQGHGNWLKDEGIIIVGRALEKGDI